MKKKYFFFDIDGTLTDKSTGKVVHSALSCLHELQAEGHFVAIATGRAHYKARGFMEQIGLHDMVCCGGGGLVINDELVRNTPLDLEKAKAILKEEEELGYGVLLQLNDSVEVYSKNDLFRQQCGPRQEPTEYFIDPNLDYDKLDVIYKMYFSIPKEDEYKLKLKDTLGNLRYRPEYLMYQYDAKHEGIVEMMEILNAPLEDVVVFGDDYNDAVMFDSQWTSIAMGNACQELKDKADFVTKDNVDDGIYYACKKFGWID